MREEAHAKAEELQDSAKERVELKVAGMKVEWRKRTRKTRSYPVETVRGKGRIARTRTCSSIQK